MVPPRRPSVGAAVRKCQFGAGDDAGTAECGGLLPATTGPKKVTASSTPVEYPSSATSPSGFHFANSARYMVLFITTICLSLSMSNSVALNFTVICMNHPDEVRDEEQSDDGEDGGWGNQTSNLSSSSPAPRPLFSNAQRALLFSAVPVGTLLGTVPITPLASLFGMRKTFCLYGLLSALATLFTPLSVSLHFGLILLMRFFQGLAVAICFPASGAIIAEWCPLRNAGIAVALLSCHIQFGPILTMPLAGELCESRWGWAALYYIQAFLTFIAYGAFFCYFRDSPRHHRNVSGRELYKIQLGKAPPPPALSKSGVRPEGHIPYRAMLLDPAVWGIFLCSMGSTFGFYVFMQYGPIYLNKTLKFDVERTGFAVALPCLLSLLAKFIVGPASDYATFISDRCRVLLFATVSQVLMAACFCALALLPPDSPRWLLQSCFTAVTVVCSVNCVGVGKSQQLISRQFAHVVTSFSVFACSFTIILIPVMVSTLAPDNEPAQWSRIFLLVAAVVVACVLVFDCTAEATPRPWTYPQGTVKGEEAEEDEEEGEGDEKKKSEEVQGNGEVRCSLLEEQRRNEEGKTARNEQKIG